jgi:hypothetical protein
MKAVNAATQMIVSLIEKRAKEIPFEGNPYHGLLEARAKLGKDEWTPDIKEPALAALKMWVMNMLGDCVSSTMNEIVALARIAEKGNEEEQNAAKEMAGSMTFLENIIKVFLNEVDIDYVAERMFEIGEKMAADLKKKATQKPKQFNDWFPARWNPSAN